MSETLTGQTTREITFDVIDHTTRRCVRTEKRPAGTEVYARLRSDGTFAIRIPGTLLTQDVYPASIESI